VRILILFCGGTLVMEENDVGALVTPHREKAIETLHGMEPQLQRTADLWVSYIDNIDSTNIQPEHWDRMARVIADNYDGYDGFVVTHGTDTMAYTASALSFALRNLGKPVVLTGAQIPGARLESDARRNFVNAVRVAALDLSGVVVVFGEKILLGCRATKVSESRLDAFASVNRPSLGEIRIDIRLRRERRHRAAGQLDVQVGFEPDIAAITLVPGLPSRTLLRLLDDGIRGLILKGYGPGNIGYQYLEVLQGARDRRIPVVVHTQCMEGATAMHLYDVGRKALEMGVIEAFDMSLEGAVTKLMWVLRHSAGYEEVGPLMHTSLAGEITGAIRGDRAPG
jgi:L-asparaginase